VGRGVIGKNIIDETFVSRLRDMKLLFGGSEVGIRDAPGKDGNVLISVVGKGVGNVGRKLA
jgi:RNA 3'-terminal phosphate cyclase-like protein